MPAVLSPCTFGARAVAAQRERQAGDTVAVQLIQPGHDARVFYVPNCADLDAQTARRLDGADLVFFDGTLCHDDETIAAGLAQHRDPSWPRLAG